MEQEISYLPFSIKPVDVITTKGHAFRSHAIHSSFVKHCIEGTYKGQSPSYHIGFSPVPNIREFVTFLRERSNDINLYQRTRNEFKYLFSTYVHVEDDETYLVCLDTNNTQILYVHGGNSEFRSYTPFPETKEWYAYVDGSTEAVSAPTHLEVNLGYSVFKNKIPDGFSPWIYGIDDLKGISFKKMTLNCGMRTKNHFIYIIVITAS